jgi:hypothetical protein
LFDLQVGDVVTVGDDVLQGTNDSDRINGLGGNDRISIEGNFGVLLGGSGDDALTGNQGNDSLLGELGNDILVGSLGNDILNGGANTNELRGGEGQDLFVLNRNGFATIEDFQGGLDTIDLAGSLTFSDLNIAQQGSDTAIRFGETELAILPGIEANSLNASDFTGTMGSVRLKWLPTMQKFLKCWRCNTPASVNSWKLRSLKVKKNGTFRQDLSAQDLRQILIVTANGVLASSRTDFLRSDLPAVIESILALLKA